MFLCPSDPAPQVAGRRLHQLRLERRDWNAGGGRNGFSWHEGTFGNSAIMDGLSATAMFTEFLHADETAHRLRNHWSIRIRSGDPSGRFTHREEFIRKCETLPPLSGRLWIRGDAGAGHQLDEMEL